MYFYFFISESKMNRPHSISSEPLSLKSKIKDI